MVVDNGRGYVPATEHSPNVEIGIIPVMPCTVRLFAWATNSKNCALDKRPTTISSRWSFWTNGSIGPEMALTEAAKIMRKHLNPFVQYSELGPLRCSPVQSRLVLRSWPTPRAKRSWA